MQIKAILTSIALLLPLALLTGATGTASTGSLPKTDANQVGANTRLAADTGAPAAAGERRRRGALAGPASRPAGESASDADKERGPGRPLFKLMDRNRDGKLQPAEIEHFASILKAAKEASEKADLTPEDWQKFAEQMRPMNGKPLRGAKKNKV